MILENREISWLSFNYRVLQEAKDLSNPLYERIKFLAIYSSNLDEFFRVRVASLRSLLRLKKKSIDKLNFDPEELLKQIHNTVNSHQEEFGGIFKKQVIPELKENNIHLINETELNDKQKEFVETYFREKVQMFIQPILLVKRKIVPFLVNRRLYLSVKLAPKHIEAKLEENKRTKHTYALVEIPSQHLPRFLELPKDNKNTYIIFLDDVIRFCLPNIFPGYEVVEVCSIKLTRDAELYIDDEFTGNLLSKIKKGLSKRDTGVPSRFLYDKNTSKPFLKFLKDSLLLEKEDLVPGGKYHNFSDLFAFPNPCQSNLEFPSMPPLKHAEIEKHKNIFEAISEKDHALFFPFQSYDYIIKFLDTAANDPQVTSIRVTQYRVAKDSAVVRAMIDAVKNGKDVMVFVEVKARFDEELNIQWAEEMEKAGVKVFYSFPGLKVHAKLALVTRIENGKEIKYSYFGTGNFNEKTAKIYSDIGLLTKDERLTSEAEYVFKFLSGETVDYKFEHLLVAQFNMRKDFIAMIDNEITLANKGKDAAITLKMNSLEDRKMIKKLYEASNAGVRINIIIRGICCLVPGIKGQSENIKVISILDRFLEHGRIYIFNNGGKEKIYAASADWMKRNLSRRVEVAFPIYNENIKKEIKDIIELQLNDNKKARVIDKDNSNNYLGVYSKTKISSQTASYNYFKKKLIE